MSNIVYIQDLEITMSIGIYEFEKQSPQRVLVNIDAYLEENKRFQDDQISETVSYEDIVKLIKELASEKHYALVETLAEDIARDCLDQFAIKTITVDIGKPDIFEDAKAVGIKIQRP